MNKIKEIAQRIIFGIPLAVYPTRSNKVEQSGYRYETNTLNRVTEFQQQSEYLRMANVQERKNMKNRKKDFRSTGLAIYCFAFCLALAVSSAARADYSDWRGIILGGAPANDGGFYSYDVFVKINDEAAVYFAALPSQNGKAVGHLFQYFPRDDNSYRFQVIACDSHGYEGPPSDWSERFVSDFVTSDCSAKTVPVADPGQDRIAEVGSSVTLDASGSYALFADDIPNLKYYWECYAAPENVTLTGAETACPAFTPNTPGSYYFRLHVRDQIDSSDFNRGAVRYVKVDAVEDLDDFVVANPGPAQSVPLGSTVILDGSFSDSFPPILDYRWEALNKTVEIQNAGEAVASFTADAVGTHVFQLTVIVEHDFSSKITVVSVYDEDAVGSLHTPEIERDCIDCSIGDLDDDGDADGSDLAAFASSFSSSRGLENYRVDCDFDKNLRVDKTDSAILAPCYGKTGI